MEYLHGFIDGVIFSLYIVGKTLDSSDSLESFRTELDKEMHLFSVRMIKQRGEELEQRIIQEP